MRNLALVTLALVTATTAQAQDTRTSIPSKDSQITTALYAAPEDKRDDAKVYGYNDSGEFMVLREGTNDLVCLADDPNKPGISVACYFKNLDPYMARGRELIAEGKTELEKREIRGKEMDAGTLKVPDKSILYVYSAADSDFDPATGELAKGKMRYVIYTPYATVEETGLPDKPYAPGMPWLMDPGTHRAHIMITPPN